MGNSNFTKTLVLTGLLSGLGVVSAFAAPTFDQNPNHQLPRPGLEQRASQNHQQKPVDLKKAINKDQHRDNVHRDNVKCNDNRNNGFVPPKHKPEVKNEIKKSATKTTKERNQKTHKQ